MQTRIVLAFAVIAALVVAIALTAASGVFAQNKDAKTSSDNMEKDTGKGSLTDGVSAQNPKAGDDEGDDEEIGEDDEKEGEDEKDNEGIDEDGKAAALLTIPQPPLVGELKKLPVAPDSQRVDLAVPSFSNPTNITNPLFPISKLHSAVLLGSVDGQPLRVETTLLPDTKTITWNGQKVETRVSQYVAYLDGRIEEVALDFYAQADDGSVWYFGEDVFNYKDGIVADTEGTWLAAKDGPVALIMPANPKVGDVFRPENVPGLVFEEVTVKSINLTVDGPQGPVNGAIVTKELHMDGTMEDKFFAPGYGEFSTGSGGNLEAIALAVPTDALPASAPAELVALSSGSAAVFDAAGSGDWSEASATLDVMNGAWDSYQAAGAMPELLNAQMNDALDTLVPGVGAHNPAEARQAALDVAQASLDFQLRHRPPVEIDFARFDLWAHRLLVDAAAGEPGAVAGDVATLERIWERVAHAVDASDAKRVNAQLIDLRAAVDNKDVSAAAKVAERLRETLAGFRPGS